MANLADDEEEMNRITALLDSKMPMTDAWIRSALMKSAGHLMILLFSDEETIKSLLASPIGKEIVELCNPTRTLQLLLHLHKARCELASIKAAEELIAKASASG